MASDETASDYDDVGADAMFAEPEGYYQPEKKPTIVSYDTQAGQTLSLSLVGHSPLWVGTTTPVPYCLRDPTLFLCC